MEGEGNSFLGTGPERYHAYLACAGSYPVLAADIMDNLSKEGILVYQKENKVDGKEKVEQGIMQSSKILLLLASGKKENAWCQLEKAKAIEKAESLYNGLLVVVLGPGVSTDNLPENLEKYQRFEWDGTDEVAKRIRDYLASDLSRSGELLPKTNMGAAFAYAYFRGYLKIILPGMADRLKNAGIGNKESDPQKRNLCPTFVIIIPETCHGPPRLTDFDDRVVFYTHLKYNVDRGGQVARDYQSTVYKMTTGNEQEPRDFLFMAEMPQILINLYEMNRDGWFGFNKDKLALEMPQFYHYLKRLVELPANRDCKDQVSFLYHRNTGSGQQSLGELLERKVKDEIFDAAVREKNRALENGAPRPMETDQSPAGESETDTLRPVEAPFLRGSLAHLYLGVYPMKKRPVGLAFIINNIKFDNLQDNLDLPERLGADVDEEVMKTLLEGIGFNVEVKRDLTVAEIMEWVALGASPERHQDVDAFAFVLMSHGQLGKIYGRHGDVVNIVDILDMISKCDSLKGKPKIGFVQACQVLNHRNVKPEEAVSLPDKLEEDLAKMKISSDAATPWVDHDVLKSSLVPSAPDFILSYATLPGMRAFRHEFKGSFYIHALKDCFARGGHMEIETWLKMVHQQVKEEMKRVFPDSVFKPRQLPFYITTGDRLLHLK